MYSKKLRQEIEQLIKDEELYCSIEEFSDKVDWKCISKYYKLSESFIEKFQDKVDWMYISKNQKLSEKFITKYQDRVWWNDISESQKLSEEFIRKFQDKIHWNLISIYQKLSESFIEKCQINIYWDFICKYQKLSEDFMERFQDKIDLYYISKYQKLSERFIEKFQDKIDLDYILFYQKLSKNFRKKYNLTIPKNNWLYTSESDKIDYIKENTDYEIKKDDNGYYLELYKSVRSDYYSVYNFQYKYEVGKTYESQCDHNINEYNSFGLSSWSKAGALAYYDEGRLLKIKVYVKDIGTITSKGKVRSTKLTILEEILDF